MLALELSGVHIGRTVGYTKNNKEVIVFGMYGLQQGADWNNYGPTVNQVANSKRVRFIGWTSQQLADKGERRGLQYHTIEFDAEVSVV